MNYEKLRKELQSTEDKIGFLVSDKMTNEAELNIEKQMELVALCVEFLSDEEKKELFNCPFYSNKLQCIFKRVILSSVINEDIFLQMLFDDKVSGEFDILQDIKPLIKQKSDKVKKQVLFNLDFIKKHTDGHSVYMTDIIKTLSEESKIEFLKNKEISLFYVPGDYIAELICTLSNDEEKKSIMQIYKLENNLKIIKTFRYENIRDYILKNKLFKADIMDILHVLDTQNLKNFIIMHRDYLKQNDIFPYEIISNLSTEKQIEIFNYLNDMNLTTYEKKEILATFNRETKEKIDKSTLSGELRCALTIETSKKRKKIIFYEGKIKYLDFFEITIDWKRNLEDYRGLDHLININPEDFTEEQRNRFIKLCEICPKLQVENNLDLKETVSKTQSSYISSGVEYLEAEKWITNLINSIKPEYTKAQKLAIVDNAIGKKVSYIPENGTEIEDEKIEDSRAIWRIISSGYGVCIGIARIEQYILKRIGIESEIVGSENHAFLKIKDIELPLANGEVVRGDTIVDPTWNLTSHRFGGKPENFCINYRQARQNDIDGNFVDQRCHKNDEELKDVTLCLDEQGLRKLFASVGLANKDGEFPITELKRKSKQINIKFFDQTENNINAQLMLLKEVCPEFATCQNSSMSIITSILLNYDNLSYDKCVVKRVYNKKDSQKRAVMYIYITSDELGRKFYVVEKGRDENNFIELTPEEFISEYECYEFDLIQSKGIRPWESIEKENDNIKLACNSGTVR